MVVAGPAAGWLFARFGPGPVFLNVAIIIWALWCGDPKRSRGYVGLALRICAAVDTLFLLVLIVMLMMIPVRDL
jgi:hypothetical protein